jgi:hypothetical protein
MEDDDVSERLLDGIAAGYRSGAACKRCFG